MLSGDIIHDVWFPILHFRIWPRWPSIIWQTCRPTTVSVCLNVKVSTHCISSRLYRLLTIFFVAPRRLYIGIVREACALLLSVSMASDSCWSEPAAACLWIRNLVSRAPWPGSRLTSSVSVPNGPQNKRQGLMGR